VGKGDTRGVQLNLRKGGEEGVRLDRQFIEYGRQKMQAQEAVSTLILLKNRKVGKDVLIEWKRKAWQVTGGSIFP